MLITLVGLSLVGGFFAGLLGVGGAVVLIPLMLTVPPLFGMAALTMNEVAGLTMVQVLAASITGWASHRRSGYAHMPTILAVGIPMALASFAGAALSTAMSGTSMLVIFGGMVAAAFVMLLKPAPDEDDDTCHVTFNHTASAACGATVGLLAGIVGAGGGFVLVPVMIRILKFPVRIAVGSSLGIVFMGALTGTLGKTLTMQVHWPYAAALIAGSLPASLLGAQVSTRLPPAVIRRTLSTLVLLILVKTWIDILRCLPVIHP